MIKEYNKVVKLLTEKEKRRLFYLIIVKIEKSRVVSTRVNIEPTEIKNRFMDSLKK